MVEAMTEALTSGSILDAWIALAAHADFNQRAVGEER